MKKLSLLFVVLLCLGASNARSQNVLVEVFTNTDCGNCVTVDNKLDLAIDKNPNIIPIFIHTHWPSRSDPFFKSSASAADYRSGTFYGVSVDPWAFVNGTDAHTDYPSWSDAISSVSTNYPAQLTVNSTPFATGVTIKVHATGTSSNHQVRLLVAMTESNINFNNTLSFGNPENKPIWNNVFRTMLPSNTGDAAFILNSDRDFSVNLDTTGTGWNLANMKAIAFLQEDYDATADVAPIYGLGVLNLATSGVVMSPAAKTATLGASTANPFTSSTELPITLGRAGHVKVVVVNLLGAEVAVLTDRMMTQGSTNLPVNGNSLPAGIYEARMFVDGALVGSTKIAHLQ